jgi:hypothetical protein
VSRARDEFEQLGLHPRGFIAPAWLLSDAAEKVLAELGFQYTTRLGGVTDLSHNIQHRSQSLVWSTRSAWRRATSLAWNAALFSRLKKNPLMRISLHPPDLQNEKIWRQIRGLIERAVADRTAMTYENWIDSRHLQESVR